MCGRRHAGRSRLRRWLRRGRQDGMTADRPPADGGSGARGQRATHKRRGPAPHLAKPGVQPGAESDGASGGLGVPRALPLARGMSKPVASGENACTREQRSGGPSSAQSGGTTDHAAERGRVGHYRPRQDAADVPRAAPAASVGRYVPTLAKTRTTTRTTQTATLHHRPASALLITHDGGSHERKESPPCRKPQWAAFLLYARGAGESPQVVPRTVSTCSIRHPLAHRIPRMVQLCGTTNRR